MTCMAKRETVESLTMQTDCTIKVCTVSSECAPHCQSTSEATERRATRRMADGEKSEGLTIQIDCTIQVCIVFEALKPQVYGIGKALETRTTT